MTELQEMPSFLAMRSTLRSLSLFQIELVSELPNVIGIRDLARRFDLDPATVSRRLRDIENSVGFEIMQRSSTGIRLTARGEEIAKICKSITAETQNILALNTLRSPYADCSLVTIGSRGFFNVALAKILAQSEIGQTKVRWRFVDSSPLDLLRGSLAGAVDVAIHFEQWTWPGSWETRPAASLNWGLIARANHPLKNLSSLEDVRKHPFVVASYLNQDRIERASDIFPLKWNERILGHEAQTAASMRSIVLSSDHIAFVPLLTVEEDLENQDLKIVCVEGIEPFKMNLYLTFQDARLKTKELDLIIGALKKIDEINSRISKTLGSVAPSVPTKMRNAIITL